ncbi:MAG: hypothetical protein ABEJ96_08735, partial [Thiohalorhabdaceae bacterium]
FVSALVVDLIEEKELAVTGLTLNDIDDTPLAFLSSDAHTYFNGNTRVHGKVTVEGSSDDALQDLVLEVVQGGTVVATADLAPTARDVLLQPFGEDGQIGLASSQRLFDLASAQADNVDGTENGTLSLRLRAESANGETATREAGSAGLLVDFDGDNRYGQRDTQVGGDDWARPSLLGIVQAFDGAIWGDFSNMNAGAFPPHSSHKTGKDADGWFKGYNARDAETAQTLIEFLNTGAGSEITTVLVTFQQSDEDPFWNAIQGVNLDDGRAATEVIRPHPGHEGHFHIRE